MTNSISRMQMSLITRRTLLGAAGLATLTGGFRGMPEANAAEGIGSALDIRGHVNRVQNKVENRLKRGAPIHNNDLISAGKDGFAELALGADTRILMGADTEVLIDAFLADQGGTLELISGQMVFDRPEGLPKIDLTLRTTFGQIGVRGTKFFCGVNRGAYAVFVEHGLVEVKAGKILKKVGAGEGVDIAADSKTRSLFGGEISPVRQWGKGRIEEAYRSAGLLME